MLFKRKCKITFISHGSTIYTEENRLCDNDAYPPLNDKGKEEAENIAKWIIYRSPRVDKIYTSAAQRCIQTASIIAKAYQKDFEILDNLPNKKAGIWNGLSYDQIEEKYPAELELYHQDSENFVQQDGESLKDLNLRVENFLEKIVEENITRRIIIVTHPDIIKAAIRSALQIPIQNQNRVFIPTGSASQINYYKSWKSLVYSGYLSINLI